MGNEILGPVSESEYAAIPKKFIAEPGRSRRNAYQSWYAYLARSTDRLVNVAYIGASDVAGYPCTSWDDTPSAVLRDALRNATAIRRGGRGYIPVEASGMQYLSPITYTGGAVNSTAGYGQAFSHWASNVAGNKAVLTLARPVSSFDIYQIKGSLGAVGAGYYKIDGGASVTFDTNAASNTPAKLHVASAAKSTIEVGVVANGPYVTITGFGEFEYDENTGIQVHKCGLSGSSAKQWATTAGVLWPAAIALFNPDMIVIELGGNDRIVSVGNSSAATFKTNVQSMLTMIRAAGITCPVTLSMVYDIESSTYTYVEPWANYVTAARQIELVDSTVTVVDHSALMPATNASNTFGIYNADQVHSEAGGAAYRLIASHLAKTLTAEVTPPVSRAATQSEGFDIQSTTATAVTAAANTWYVHDPTSGNATFTLPVNALNGAEVRVEHYSSSTNTITIQRGGSTDLLDDGTTSLTISTGERATFTYRLSTGRWHMQRQLWRAINGTIMRRDQAGRVQVTEPALPADVATKSYSDTKVGWGAADVGFIAWNYDPVAVFSNSIPAAGALQMCRIKIPKAVTITNLYLSVVTAGATLTSGQNFAALFDVNRNRLGVTADQTTAWASTGLKTMALTTPQAVAAGEYFVGFYANGTTRPAFARANAADVVNGILSLANARWAASSTGLTTAMPNPAAALTLSTTSYWAAVS